MQIQVLKSKIHSARLTDCRVDYEGSMAIDPELYEAVGMVAYERILVVNSTNGERLETYVIPGTRGAGEFILNGAAAHRGSPGDTVTIMSFAYMSSEEADTFSPCIHVLSENNEVSFKRNGGSKATP